MTTPLTPVGYYCDHTDEPIDARTHHDWEFVEGEGFVFQHQPDTITALSHTEQTYLKPEHREQRCARAVPVYPGPAVEAELDRLRDELAETKANHNPRLRCLIVKASKDRDLYIGWSNSCEMPAGAWTREEALAYGFPRSRLDRAEQNGSSSLHGDGGWDDKGFVAEQRGWLRRDRLGDYAQLWLADRQDEAFDLLEPFEGETEVRRT
ncbi:hypothetical protein ACFCYB_00330 [Streptomyces sp. NPDC056309]|uniref:hypothetical protein n=1 Tax=Streptomyces sp. NPDC056309 TaxID=3345781 RepID=UPI0035DC9351